jgi:plasmid maintenance system antidote protein VapI
MDELTDRIRTTAKRLGVTRTHAKEIEAILRKHINRLAEIRGRGTMKILATDAGVSEQHMSDIRHGRRGIGDGLVERLGGLR